jgi:hypothetical protein
MPLVKYRMINPALDPRRPKLEVPGWAGQQEPRANGSMEYPWHCIPFSEAARAGIELCYPHPHELHVTLEDGEPTFAELGTVPPDGEPPPFRSFGKPYYTYQLLLDLKVPDDYAIKTEPHPRFYTDTTGTAPIAVPAIIRHWWPMIFFVVFKSPLPGQTHIFRPGEPFMQITFVPAEEKMELVPMPDEEAAERELMSRRIYASRETLAADTQWTSATSTVFDGTYRRLFGAAKAAARK